MSKLLEQINIDLKQAMRDKNELVVSTLRMLSSAVKEKEISLRKGDAVVLSDEQIVDIISSEVKKRKDSVVSYESGGRQDLADKEKEEIKILEKYMPEQLSDEELEKIVKEIVSSLGEVSMKDFGKIMGQIVPRTKGRADGNKISEMVKKILS